MSDSGPIEAILCRLSDVKKNGDGYVARCPVHDDHHPSLSVKQGDDGRVLLHCFAGCTTDEIVAAVGLQTQDLFAKDDKQAAGDEDWTPRGPALASYPYTDETGELLFTVCRTADKEFPCWRPDPTKSHGKSWSLNGVPRVLYRLPQVLDAVARGETIYIVEGEKDVEALVAVGAAATCNPGGAGKWREEYADHLTGAQVIVVADKDEPGRRHAAMVAASLTGKARSLTMVEARQGKDAADHLAAGYAVDDFEPMGAEPETPKLFFSAPELRDYVSPDIDWIVEKILARGVFTIFGGKPKSGKTTALFGAVYAIQTGRPFMGLKTHPARVLYITEQNKTTVRPKLAEYDLLDNPDVHVMFPRQMLGLGWAEIITQAATYCEDHDIGVVIVDTVNDLCHLEDTNSDTLWIEALNPLQGLAEHGGLAVLASLHAKKEAASLVDMFRGSNAIVGKADIVLGLWRDGSGEETSRTIEGMSRLDNGFDERTRIVRQGREYLVAGTVKGMELEMKLGEYLGLLPTDQAQAMTRREIAEALAVSPATVTTYLEKLLQTGQALSATRPGRGNTRIYWAGGAT